MIGENYPERYLNETEIAVNTGMRKGEQFSLPWTQVDPPNMRVRLLRTKNGSARTIPLNSIALAAFECQHKITGNHKHVFLNDDGKPFAKKALVTGSMTR